MISFALPNFYENSNIHAFLYDLVKTHPEYFKEPVSFYISTGAFPYSSWNGGINCNVGRGAFYGDFITTQNFRASAMMPLRLNMANILLESTDYYDHMNAAILDIFHDGSTVLEVSSIPLMEYIQEKYPDYRFAFSKQADLITEFTPELLTSLAESNNFIMIGLPDRLTYDLDFLKTLKKKSCFEITVNPICPVDCDGCSSCWIAEHQNQLEYSGQQNILMCNKKNSFLNTKTILSIEEIKKTYVPLGLTHFTFSTQYVLSPDELVDFYIQYFIKPEYGATCFNEWAQFQKQLHGGM